MNNCNLAQSLLEKCNIFYENELLSKEALFQEYIKFLSEGVESKNKNILFGLHTESQLFDIVSILIAALGSISFDTTTNEDVLDSLQKGDMVIYKNSRYRWIGKRYCKKYQINGYNLEQDTKDEKDGNPITFVLSKDKHLIRPYYGNSKSTDGKGLGKVKSNREDFLAFLFGITPSQVPNEINASIVLVCDKEYFYKLVKGIRIEYEGGKSVNILDIVPASYYTFSNKEQQIGDNPLKAEPVLKVTKDISSARRLILEYKAFGLVIMGANSTTSESIELEDLLSRESLGYININGVFCSALASCALRQNEKTSLFACTKNYLKQVASSNKDLNSDGLIAELCEQINIITQHTVSEYLVDASWNNEEYISVCTYLKNIQESSWTASIRNDFLYTAYSLIKLLNTAIFPLKKLENAINDERLKLNVASPQKNIEKLENLALKSPLREKCLRITEFIRDKYRYMLTVCPKFDALIDCISNSAENARIAVVVPKAYYATMLRYSNQQLASNKNIELTTPKKFNLHRYYDNVIVVGNFKDSLFDLFSCQKASKVTVLVHNHEREVFRKKQKRYVELIKKIDQRIGIDNFTESNGFINTCVDEALTKQQVEAENILEDIGNQQSSFLNEIIKNASTDQSKGYPVIATGTFVNGKIILFSQYYKAKVFVQEERRVKEDVDLNDITAGDILCFFNRDSSMKKMVRDIFDELIAQHKFNEQTIKDVEKAKYWKESLRHYKNRNRLSFRDITKALERQGTQLEEVTIREWLKEDSYIVGPRDEQTMQQIANLTRDYWLLSDVTGYFGACQRIRKKRKQILKIVDRIILKRLQGKVSEIENKVENIIRRNVNKLSQILELEKIEYFNEEVFFPMGFINKPINKEDLR